MQRLVYFIIKFNYVAESFNCIDSGIKVTVADPNSYKPDMLAKKGISLYVSMILMLYSLVRIMHIITLA